MTEIIANRFADIVVQTDKICSIYMNCLYRMSHVFTWNFSIFSNYAEQNSSWKSDCLSVGNQFRDFYGTLKFNTVLMTGKQWILS